MNIKQLRQTINTKRVELDTALRFTLGGKPYGVSDQDLAQLRKELENALNVWLPEAEGKAAEFVQLKARLEQYESHDFEAQQ